MCICVYVSVHLLHNKSICGSDLLQLVSVYMYSLVHSACVCNVAQCNLVYHRESSECANNVSPVCVYSLYCWAIHVGGRRGRLWLDHSL